MDVVRLYVVSYYGDMWKERDTLFRDVLPDLRAWCENKRMQLLEKDIKWGGYMSMDDLSSTKLQIQQAYYNGEMPFFVHLTSESLGIVPMYGEAAESLTSEIHKKLQVNAEEMDILYGAYKEDNPNSVFLIRSDHFLDDLEPEDKKFFVRKHFFSGPQHEICSNCLNKYPEERIFRYSYDKTHLPPATRKVEIDWDKSVFFKVLRYIEQQIERERPGLPAGNNTDQQFRESQENFMKTISQRVKGRENMLSQLEDYIETGGKDVPLLLLGGAGSGKSSIMAKAAYQFSQTGYLNKYLTDSDRDAGRSWLVFYLFAGAVPGSVELLSMLQRLLKELHITTDSTIPHKVDAAAQMCCSALSGGTERPLVLIVDAVNQFDEEAASQIMSWIPRKLAPNVRCILSMDNDSIQHKTLMSRESKPHELHVSPLHFEARKLIVMEKLQEYDRSVTRNQMNCLLAKKGSENPLWLSLASEELRGIQEPQLFDRCIREMPEILQDLLESVLERLERNLGNLLVSCLCLLEVSVTGLLQAEIRSLLGTLQERVAPAPYEEKEETESSEKDLGRRREGLEPLSEQQWWEIYDALRPYLRPCGDTRDGRLDFYHRAFSKAVRTKYFKVGRVNESSDESLDLYRHWHQQLADYFEQCTNIDRKAEEYLGHLVQIEDRYRLCQALCDWSILDKLYHDEYSSQLLAYWRKAGGTDQMICCYSEALIESEAIRPRDNKLMALRYKLVARIYLQAGKYTEALELAKTVIKWEEKELGNRPESMVELNSLMAEIYEEKLKLNDFVSVTQLPDLRKTIMYARKSIEIRKTFTGVYHELKLAISLMKLAFSLESWSACGGDESEMTGEEAIREGNKHIDEAIKIFSQLKDAGHYAEALMTKGVLAPRGSMQQLKHYNEAMEICRQVYGEESLLSSRLYINIGIVYEDNNDYLKAYEYFKKWAETSEIVLGPDHPKTIRAKGVLREPRYRLVALRVRQHSETNNQNDGSANNISEETINNEVANLDEEEGYQGDVQDDDGEENLELRESREGQGDIRQIVEASDIMQRIFSDIWQRMGDDGPGQGETLPEDPATAPVVNDVTEMTVQGDAPNNQVAAAIVDAVNQVAAPVLDIDAQVAALDAVNQDAANVLGLDERPVLGPSPPLISMEQDLGLGDLLQIAVNNMNTEIDIGDNRYSDSADNDEPLEAVITRFLQEAQSAISSENTAEIRARHGDDHDDRTQPDNSAGNDQDNMTAGIIGPQGDSNLSSVDVSNNEGHGRGHAYSGNLRPDNEVGAMSVSVMSSNSARDSAFSDNRFAELSESSNQSNNHIL